MKLIIGAVVIGGETQYKLKDYYFPLKAEEENWARTKVMYQEAQRISPTPDKSSGRLDSKGITDKLLCEVAKACRV